MIFLDMKSKAQTEKAKINKWDYIKLKSFTKGKETNKMKRQPMEWEKIFANNASDKWLISKLSSQSSISVGSTSVDSTDGRPTVYIILYKGLEHLWGFWNHSPQVPRDNCVRN